ncbi:TIGR04255 family protein [Paraburkholderia acidisoli]|uniref:TIGR04255 family protein n=1 Tax=Paraburkholderia acidisoli TaxID=2571748 RepID=A0A7Z2JGE8_9BURK|nr:TIGR04255 family protein [Paraburkholderia acidisoli]QGZ62120.1 TIGR04255 family protein [Paraburkholderia acidisoli]
MDLSALYPAGGNHAIQNVAFVLEWPVPLTESNIATAKEIHQRHLLKAFPRAETPQIITFNFQAGIGAPPQPPQAGIGLMLTRPRGTAAGNNVAASIQITQQNCVIVVNEYTRWATIWADVSHWLRLLLPAIQKDGNPLTGATLQYTDAFEWRGNPREFIPKVLFSADSTFVPKNALSSLGLWHSHHGFFVEVDPSDGYQLLENVNVNVHEHPESRQRAVVVMTSHKATFSEGIWGSDKAVDALDPLMTRLHERNKDILRDMLASDVKKMIKLDVAN